MPPLITQSRPALVWFLFAVVVWLAQMRFAAASHRGTSDSEVRDRSSRALLIVLLPLATWVALAAAWKWPSAAVRTARPLVFDLGIILMLAGAALRQYAVRSLGRFFTCTVMVHRDQTVVETGPYRYVRHPAYSAALLSHIGLGLALTNWASVAASLLLSGAGYAYRIAVEERALQEKIGAPYTEYCLRTRRLVPRVF